ncbi:hypothetical protein, partial [Staphylococcus epidermidis]|uniref:hypothetical protein n=1 Tax=Staphylococcus epidermidis TaxID=1282 RepID=UPI001C92CD77
KSCLTASSSVHIHTVNKTLYYPQPQLHQPHILSLHPSPPHLYLPAIQTLNPQHTQHFHQFITSSQHIPTLQLTINAQTPQDI